MVNQASKTVYVSATQLPTDDCSLRRVIQMQSDSHQIMPMRLIRTSQTLYQTTSSVCRYLFSFHFGIIRLFIKQEYFTNCRAVCQ